MKSLPFLFLLFPVGLILSITPSCILEPDTQFIYKDTTMVVDTIVDVDTFTVYLDTFVVHDTTIQTVHDTVHRTDTVKIINTYQVGAPNLISASYKGGSSDYIYFYWCKMSSPVSFKFYFAKSLDSTFTLQKEVLNSSLSTYSSNSTYAKACSGEYNELPLFVHPNYSWVAYGKVNYVRMSAVDSNGVEGEMSQIRQIYVLD